MANANAVKMQEGIYWVGAVDRGLRNFHGYRTQRGSTYNAYLIIDDKTTLVDTVKAPFFNEMMARIKSVLNPAEIDYIISNHSEMDHSGSLPKTISEIDPEKVFASKMGKQALREHFGLDEEITEVADGETLSLGNRKLLFIETKMVHWPDSMFSYMPGEGLLFSQDGFGMHLATDRIFDDENDREIMDYEAKKYYANILMPLSRQIEKLLKRVEELGVPINIIAPDHGPVWRSEPERIMRAYARWCRQEPENRAVIIYDTMWKSTRSMAEALAQGIREGGTEARLMWLEKDHRSDVATEMLGAGALLVGSPTMNNQILPPVADAMTYLRGLKPRNLAGCAFGSYGWSGEAPKIIHGILDEMGVDVALEDIRVKYVPTPDDLEQCRRAGRDIAAKIADKQ